MKKTFLLYLLLILLAAPISVSAKTGYLYVHDGDIFGSFALVERLDFPYSGELWLVEVGIGCSMWMQDGKNVLFDTGYGTFLDGFSDKIIVANAYSTSDCKIWDAFPLSNWEFKLFGYEKDQFILAMAGLSIPSSVTYVTSSSISASVEVDKTSSFKSLQDLYESDSEYKKIKNGFRVGETFYCKDEYIEKNGKCVTKAKKLKKKSSSSVSDPVNNERVRFVNSLKKKRWPVLEDLTDKKWKSYKKEIMQYVPEDEIKKYAPEWFIEDNKL